MKYEKAKVEIVMFENEDVVTGSYCPDLGSRITPCSRSTVTGDNCIPFIGGYSSIKDPSEKLF